MTGKPIIYDFCASALTPVGNSLWFANQCKGSVQALDLVSRQISEPIIVGQQPGYMIFDGTRLWLSNVSSNSVQAIDVSSRVASAPVPVGQAPQTLACDGKRVWVLTSQSLQAIDPARGEVTATLNYFGGPGASLGVYATPSDLIFAAGRLWIVSNEPEMRALDPETQRVTAEIRVGEGSKFLAFDGERLWVANREKNTLRAVDPNSLSLGVQIGIGVNPRSMTFDGQQLWISYQDSNVVQPVMVR
jgi:YVTN family beta-propeller protein